MASGADGSGDFLVGRELPKAHERISLLLVRVDHLAFFEKHDSAVRPCLKIIDHLICLHSRTPACPRSKTSASSASSAGGPFLRRSARSSSDIFSFSFSCPVVQLPFFLCVSTESIGQAPLSGCCPIVRFRPGFPLLLDNWTLSGQSPLSSVSASHQTV